MSIPDNLQVAGSFGFARQRRFAPLFATQFLGAFNDNLFKAALFVLIGFYGLGHNSWLPESQMLNAGALLFILPYFLFSAISGQLSNKYDKAVLARWVKSGEVGIMLLAAAGFWYQSASLLMACLFLLGVQATLFGPLKYAILPDYLTKNELLAGNSLIESGTFLSILLGQMLGTVMAGASPVWLMASVLLVAVLGQISSFFLPRVPAQLPQTVIQANIFRSTGNLLWQAWRQKEIWVAIMGISWFWFIGSVYITQLPTYTRLNLGGNDSVFNLLLTLFSLGIGLGSVVCARLSRHGFHVSLIVPGIIGMTLAGLLLVWFTRGQHYSTMVSIGAFLLRADAWPVMLCIVLIGLFGGFFSVPLYTWLQTASSDAFRANAVAANNIVNGIFMVAASLMSMLLISWFDSINVLYLVVAVGNLAMLTYLLSATATIRDDFRQFFGQRHS